MGIRLTITTTLFLGLLASAESPETMDTRPPETRAIESYNEAEKAAESDPTRSAELFQEAAILTADPVLKKKALFNLGNALYKMGEPVPAIQAYQSAYDVKSGRFDKQSNPLISENIVLARRTYEKQKKQSGEQQSSSEEDGEGKQASDQKGPKTDYQAQNFSEAEKQKIYDLISNEEQQTLSRLQEQRNRGQPKTVTEKPW